MEDYKLKTGLVVLLLHIVFVSQKDPYILPMYI